MEKKKVILTRKIQVFIDCDDKEKRREYYQKLFDWQRMCFRGANYIFTHHYLQDQIKEILYITDDIRVKLANVEKDEQGILNTSKMNTTYRVLSSYFKGEMPSNIFSNLNKTLVTIYNNERSSYWKGERSLRSYKRNIPIPFSANQLKLMNDEKGRNFKFNLFKIPFRTYLGKDRSDKKVLLQRTLAGTIKLCSCSLKIDKGKLFLLATFEMERDEHQLDEAIFAEASLSIEHPISVKVGKETFQIGNKEEFLHRRLAIQAARHRLQRGSTFNRGGKGRTRKMKALDNYSEKEKRYVDNRLHLYSKRLIEHCIKNQAGTLLLVNQEQKEEIAKEEEFLLRNWSYYGLKEKIAYKANKAGINLIVE